MNKMMSLKQVLLGTTVIVGFSVIATLNPLKAEAVNLKANFRLFGEVDRFGIGYGDMALHFGVNSSATEIGSLGYIPGGTPFTSGVLSSINLPFGGGFTVVDSQFSIPFFLDIDQPGSLYMGIGDNGMGGYGGGNVQVIFDFSDNIYFGGSILTTTPDQGFTLTSVTLSDGTSLEDAGLQFDFIPKNTILTAGASAFDTQGSGLIVDSVVATTEPPNRAAVFLSKSTATAKLQGSPDGFNPNTNSLVDLDVNPEPDPFVFDLGFAAVTGTNNILLTKKLPPSTVPEASTVLGLLSLGILGVVSILNRKPKSS